MGNYCAGIGCRSAFCTWRDEIWLHQCSIKDGRLWVLFVSIVKYVSSMYLLHLGVKKEVLLFHEYFYRKNIYVAIR